MEEPLLTEEAEDPYADFEDPYRENTHTQAYRGPQLPSPWEAGNTGGASHESLMSAVLPYLIAACFFALLAGGAVFYFVAVSPPSDLQSRDLRKASSFARNDRADRQNIGFGAKEAKNEASDDETRRDLPLNSSNGTAKQLNDLDSGQADSSTPFGSGLEPKFDRSGPQGDDGGPAVLTTGLQQTREAFAARLEEENRESANRTSVSLPPDPAPQPEPLKETAKPSMALAVETGADQNLPATQLMKQADEALRLPVETPPARKAEPEAEVKQAAIPPQPESPPQAKPSMPPANVPKASEPRRLISTEQEAALLERGQTLLKMGDVSGARLILEYLAQQGSAAGAFVLAQTYDPAVLRPLGVRGVKGDPKLARSWYEKAGLMGSREALAKLGGQ